MPIRKVLKNLNSAPVKIWTDNIDEASINQLENMARLPFIFKHIAVMPDAHMGKGACVGSVLATQKAIIPSAIGVDIGCGMIACQLDIDLEYFTDKTAPIVRSLIEKEIPVGFARNKELSLYLSVGHESFIKKLNNYSQKYAYQLCSLGGGNHFIEICRDKNDKVWCVIHSGSRGFGKDRADEHINSAKGIMRQYFIELPDPELAYLASGTKEFNAYINDLDVAQYFSKLNRRAMMLKIIEILKCKVIGDHIDCHHNYVDIENHFDYNVFVTRKGAVRARKGDLGIIPGSMGNSTYIVEGLGNEESFCSCSHGAGRQFSRTQARKLFDVNRLIKETSGVECRKDDGVLDEIPSAYKRIEQVMEDQSDLVKIKNVLKQFICIKG